MKVLIVEPSKIYQKILSRKIEELGFKVMISSDVNIDLESCMYKDIDLICVAYDLGYKTGVDYCKEYREVMHNSYIPIVMLSDEYTKDITISAMKSGVTEVFFRSRLPDLLEYLYNSLQKKNKIEISGRVLIVEDNIDLALVYKQVLLQNGLQVEHYTSADEAYEVFKTQSNIDLVLTDLMLDGHMSGLTFVRSIRNETGSKSTVPIIAISSFSDVARRIELFNAGVSDYISKPIVHQELILRVKNLINNKQLLDKVEMQRLRLENLAMLDQLTMLYNRHFLTEVVPKRIKEAYRHNFPLSLIMLDLDRFKEINDTFGHNVGDKVLATIGHLLKSVCREEDIAARFGGEEFMLFLSHCDSHDAMAKAEHLRELIENDNPEGVSISVSIGVVTIPNKEIWNLEKLYSSADNAMYIAKDTGRNRVVAWDADKTLSN